MKYFIRREYNDLDKMIQMLSHSLNISNVDAEKRLLKQYINTWSEVERIKICGECDFRDECEIFAKVKK